VEPIAARSLGEREIKMKKTAMMVLALVAFGTTACGGAASKSDACGCLDATNKSFCEAEWDICDSILVSDTKSCKNDLRDSNCP
jgi:hypothetical protein